MNKLKEAGCTGSATNQHKIRSSFPDPICKVLLFPRINIISSRSSLRERISKKLVDNKNWVHNRGGRHAPHINSGRGRLTVRGNMGLLSCKQGATQGLQNGKICSDSFQYFSSLTKRENLFGQLSKKIQALQNRGNVCVTFLISFKLYKAVKSFGILLLESPFDCPLVCWSQF